MSTENVSGILFLVQSACLERRFLDDPALKYRTVKLRPDTDKFFSDGRY